jgi:protein gp37
MGEFTSIEWCDSSCNPMMGCLGCELWDRAKKIRTCYAGNLTQRHAGQPGWPASFEEPQVFPLRINTALRWKDLTGKARPQKPWLDGLPRVVFLCDLGDPFTEGLDEDWLAPFLDDLRSAPFIWLLLTKRIKRARAFFERFDSPPNVMLGTSVTDADTARLRLPDLQRAQVPGRFISAEPWLGPGGFTPEQLAGIEWLILGGESDQPNRAGRGRPSSMEDLLQAIEGARAAGAAPFVKQLGSRPFFWSAPVDRQRHAVALAQQHPKGGDWNEWPEELRVREMPPSWHRLGLLAA